MNPAWFYFDPDKEHPFESGYVILPCGKVITIGALRRDDFFQKQIISRFHPDIRGKSLTSQLTSFEVKDPIRQIYASFVHGNGSQLQVHSPMRDVFLRRKVLVRIAGEEEIDYIRENDMVSEKTIKLIRGIR